MIFLRKRLFFWLIKAYIKRWGKRFIFFFLIGLVIFFMLIKYASTFIARIPTSSHETVGLVGDYKVDALPRIVLDDLSYGLTAVEEDGTIKPAIAKKWEVKNNGKTYEFTLDTSLRFSDGSTLDSSKIDYKFSEAQVQKPDKNRIIYTLKDSYSPFLISVSRPLFKSNFIGVGKYKVKKIDLNGEFVRSVHLTSTQNSFQTKSYTFYPTQEALRLAFLLGEVHSAKGLSETVHNNISFKDFSNVEIIKNTNYSRLVTLFYNNQDSVISDQKIRNSLTYALPNNFSKGQRNTSPFSPKSWVYKDTGIAEKTQDIEHAQELLDSSSASKSAELKLTIKVFPKYKKTAEEIAKEWEKINIKTAIEEVDSVPTQYQIFLGDFLLSKDPDQYLLWHSSQLQNITHYQNLRIDKLLEDGRKTTDTARRKKIYEDFQKYLLADSPAAFLYFPYEYDLIRK